MSTDIEARAANTCCANCGKAEIDEVKLKDCHQCDLARYCGDECRQNHRETHEVICKQRAVKLRDEILFKQPEGSCLGDCPICFLPLPLDVKEFVVKSCCGKLICNGCNYVNGVREIEQRLKQKCPFCRKQEPETDEECNKNHEKRAEANDPVALRQLGVLHLHYDKGEYDVALNYWTQAAELGDAMAHNDVSVLYYKGEGVDKDEEKEIYHLEEAAIAGHPVARYNLGLYEGRKGRIGRAVKHWIIAANLGDDTSLHNLKEVYKA